MTPDARFRSALPGFAFPAFPGGRAATKLALLFQIEQGQWRSHEAIEAAQFEQLRHLVPFATATVPHYRRQIGGTIAAGAIDARAWRDIPILTRRMLHKAAMDMRSERIPEAHGRASPIRTSGSTGMVVEVLGTELTALFWEVFCLRDHLWHRRELREKLCVIRYLRDAAMKRPAGVRATGWGPATDDIAATGPSTIFDILLDVPHLLERIAAERPGYLLSHPSLIEGLARQCLDKGTPLAGLREIRTMGETPNASLRALSREVWGVPLVDMYTCQEAGYLALQCPDHEHYHVQSENVFLEVIDDRGQPCKAGEVGRVLITSLNNFATPLIRYELGDYAEVGDPCACGRGLPVLRRIMGRYRNLLTMPDGTRKWPRLGYESRLQEIAPIELMQMVQRTVEEIDVRLVMARPLTEAERDQLTSFIRGNLGHPFALRFDYVDDIRNPANGKIEQFISLVDHSK